jgi:hypothetical protein
MSSIHDEWGQPVLPGFEGEFPYQQKRGHGEGQTSSQSEDWYTHVSILECVERLYGGQIDLDPMSCAEANQMVNAKVYYTAEQDGLTRPWYGKMLWNPPWGGSDASSVKQRGVKKLLDAYNKNEVEQCVCVLNANALTTAWLAPLLDYPICIPPKRIPHYSPGGGGGSPNSGTVIIYVGPYVWGFIEAFEDLGKVLMDISYAEWA